MSESDGYECIAEVLADGGAKLFKYKSKRTGLTICIAETDGPLVGGYLCVATEAHDDDGLPHTLEHIVFLGSEKYPYKGVLDILANRCLAQGTNAWTDTDHTCYTVTTAGAEGFLALLPIYVDHLLYPTLTEEGYLTEVHHVNGEGEDAGVVYCEMQARENVGETLCHHAMLLKMYPPPCGYCSETGGKLKNLRESTSHLKVKDYHKKYYCPENLCIIIVGNIQAKDVFESLNIVEERILQDVIREEFVRPWGSEVAPLAESVLFEIEYPNDEDDSGLVIAAWRGPLANDYSQLISIQILMDYLTDTSVSPLNRELVENDDPLCNSVDYTVIENSVSCIYLHLSNVDVKQLCDVKDKLFLVLENIANGKEKLDMKRMATVIRKKKLYILSHMEDSPHDQLASCLIGDFLYGSTLEDLKHRLQEIPTIEKLALEPPEFWLNLLKEYIVDGKYVIVLGKPSIALSDSIAKEEKLRLKDQKRKLGLEGLKEKAKILKLATDANEVSPPKEALTSICVPELNCIKYHPIKRISNVDNAENSDVQFSIEKMPCRFQLDDILTSFVRFAVCMDTSDLPMDLRMYLPMFIELLDESAIKRNGEIVPYQEVVKQLEEDTVFIAARLGLNYGRFFCGTFAQMVFLEMQVEVEKYARSVQWVREILHEIVFEPARIKTTIKKIISDLASMKRDCSCINKTLQKNVTFVAESNHWVASVFRQGAFLSKLMKTLEETPDQVVADLNRLREFITTPERMTVHLSASVDRLRQISEPESPWAEDLFPKHMQPSVAQSPFKKCYELLQPFNEDSPSGLIVGVSAVETSEFIQVAPGLSSYKNPDYAALLITVQYLTQTEGLMYKRVRGMGLAYYCGISVNPNTGLIYFMLGDSNQLVKSYQVCLEVIESVLSESWNWDEDLLVSAKSCTVFETIEKVSTVSRLSDQSLRAYFSNIDIGFPEELLHRISEVTPSDMGRVAAKYLQPVFDSVKSRCAICCHTNKVKEITEGFQKFSRNLTVLPSLDHEILTAF